MASQDVSSPAFGTTGVSTSTTAAFNPMRASELIEGRHYVFEDKKFRCILDVCGACSSSFSRKNGLLKHVRTALGIRDHTCTTCNKSFSQKPHLEAHEAMHSANYKYCLFPGCLFKATDPSSYARHKKLGKCPLQPRKRTNADTNDVQLPPATRQRSNTPQMAPLPQALSPSAPQFSTPASQSQTPPGYTEYIPYSSVDMSQEHVGQLVAFNSTAPSADAFEYNNGGYMVPAPGVGFEQHYSKNDFYAGYMPAVARYNQSFDLSVQGHGREQYDSLQQSLAPVEDPLHIDTGAIDPQLLYSDQPEDVMDTFTNTEKMATSDGSVNFAIYTGDIF